MSLNATICYNWSSSCISRKIQCILAYLESTVWMISRNQLLVNCRHSFCACTEAEKCYFWQSSQLLVDRFNIIIHQHLKKTWHWWWCWWWQWGLLMYNVLLSRYAPAHYHAQRLPLTSSWNKLVCNSQVPRPTCFWKCPITITMVARMSNWVVLHDISCTWS